MFHIKHKPKVKSSIQTRSVVMIKPNTVDEGVICFGQWLNSEDKNSFSNPIVLKTFVKDKSAVLQDNTAEKQVTVEITDGVPYCKNCSSNDCMHVGFAICVEQMVNRSGNTDFQ